MLFSFCSDLVKGGVYLVHWWDPHSHHCYTQQKADRPIERHSHSQQQQTHLQNQISVCFFPSVQTFLLRVSVFLFFVFCFWCVFVCFCFFKIENSISSCQSTFPLSFRTLIWKSQLCLLRIRTAEVRIEGSHLYLGKENSREVRSSSLFHVWMFCPKLDQNLWSPCCFRSWFSIALTIFDVRLLNNCW